MSKSPPSEKMDDLITVLEQELRRRDTSCDDDGMNGYDECELQYFGEQDMKAPPFYSIFQRHEMPILPRFLTPSSRRHHWIHYPHFREQLRNLLAISTTHRVNNYHTCN